ncbi:N-alpha-acetyltransferase 20 isoform X2 [Fukomys damarensis]|nr:N-alpha-acetyltransferase 20 isoform X2 [Fukomys damarensis]XP_010632483.1 N-alpha-acetyltransferase 20 isoform X2 [Fukomys damarensis]XP_033617050.1 N-alpha-acetyltransferase 20 isoform X2 [Fukomys damarensis]
MGYIMGKAEGSVAREEWHGHVTALSVAPEFRRLGLAAKLMELLEEISERKGGFFVDLFVRVSNQVAVNMYKQLGYSVYRTVIEYYSASNGEPDEDAYDMRKALSRDTEKKSIIPLPHPSGRSNVWRNSLRNRQCRSCEPEEEFWLARRPMLMGRALLHSTALPSHSRRNDVFRQRQIHKTAEAEEQSLGEGKKIKLMGK